MPYTNILDKEQLKDLFRTFNTLFQGALESGEPEIWQQVANFVPTNSLQVSHAWLGSLYGLRRWTGSRIYEQLKTYRYDLVNEPYEVTWQVPVRDVKADNIGVYRPAAQAAGMGARMWPTDLVVQAIKDGETRDGYDGQPYFDQSHPVGKNSTTLFSNLSDAGGANPWYLLDLRKPILPFIFQQLEAPNMVGITDPEHPEIFNNGRLVYGVNADGAAGYALWQLAYKSTQTLTAANFRAARTEMRGYKTDEGRFMGVNPTHILVGNSTVDAATDLFTKDRLATGEDNTDQGAVQIIYASQLP